ncbi:iron-containing alcohol dehydrogenase family protein [Lyngbya confervoides]|uniref:Iron-containing alcohol dehydrogenase family protein n=1 Tax=Lyngbya confervoides BDU141951 TaxID=1574623 RepID=A0ABD4T8W9_9CYAN|nr:iron-containing alcohol dehydrogenase family protein [Lyngbya confervoides]MCM1985218.1 iron-containing alcohol dehydrogenase family protein [Lyngbya confervoides BDU141951]
MSNPIHPAPPPLGRYNAIAPAQVLRGSGLIAEVGPLLTRFGHRPLVIGGDQSLALLREPITSIFAAQDLSGHFISYGTDCSEPQLQRMRQAVQAQSADVVLGVGGGKALDAAKLVAYQCQCPIVTIPTSAATCAAWTALSNVYTDAGAFQYDVPLPTAPNLLILDYDLIRSAPKRTLIAGIGDALAKWYEASVSSGRSQETLIIGAVQQARVLRDILLQRSLKALAEPGGEDWQQVVDATVLMAGVIGGLGGAQCRTVAAHAVHNGLTHLNPTRQSLHGEKVAYGILVQLRLEEQVQGSQLAATARHQLLQFYGAIGLPTTLKDLGMQDISLAELEAAAKVACAPNSDLHHLPFSVTPDQLMAAMVSTALRPPLAKVNPEVENCLSVDHPSHPSEGH